MSRVTSMRETEMNIRLQRFERNVENFPNVGTKDAQ